MKRTALAFAYLLFSVAVAAAQSFSVTFSTEKSAQPLDGRLLLLLSTDPSQEPRMQIDDTLRSQIVFGLTVDGWQPGQTAVLDASASGYPIHSLKDVPAGEYTVQAVLNKYETFATRMAQEGIDLATLARILGHNSIRIVERYVHPTDEHKKNAMLRYEASQARAEAGQLPRPS